MAEDAVHWDPPPTAVVVVNYGDPSLLVQHLTRVGEENPDVRVYVVDNHSGPTVRAAVRELCRDTGWTGLYPDSNLGFGGGCNLGAGRALTDGAEQVVLLNPDASLDRASLRALRRAVQEDELLLAAPTITTPDGRPWSGGADLLLDTGSMRGWGRRDFGVPPPRSMPWISGACLAVSATLWRAVGGFDEDYFLYWEDVDLSARVQQEGGRIGIVAGATAVHDEGSTHGPGSTGRAKSSLYYYYNVRNRMLYAAKHLPPVDQRRWRRSSIREAYRIVLRGGRRQLLAPHRCLWPAARGLVAGLWWARARRG